MTDALRSALCGIAGVVERDSMFKDDLAGGVSGLRFGPVLLRRSC